MLNTVLTKKSKFSRLGKKIHSGLSGRPVGYSTELTAQANREIRLQEILERKKELDKKSSYKDRVRTLQKAILDAFIPDDNPQALTDFIIFLKIKFPNLAVQLLTRLLPKQINLDVDQYENKIAPIVIMGNLIQKNQQQTQLYQHLSLTDKEKDKGVEILELDAKPEIQPIQPNLPKKI